jgi:hypothetical protein
VQQRVHAGSARSRTSAQSMAVKCHRQRLLGTLRRSTLNLKSECTAGFRLL